MWFSFVPSIFGGPRKARHTHRVHTAHNTFTLAYKSGAGCGSGCGWGCGCGCISWLAFELWLSSAVTWLMRVAAINICHVCIAHKTLASLRERFANGLENFCHSTWLWATYTLPIPLIHKCDCSSRKMNVLQIDSTCISN